MSKILISPKFLFPTLIIASTYVVFATYLMNVYLVQNTVFGSFSISYKVSLLFALLGGMWTAMSGSILALPFHGVELSYLAAVLLSISFFLLLKSVFEKEYCVIPLKK